ncbi:MAG: zinc ABC transporter substrate-binding protein [Acidobacteria bacterium]|nr:zinc ABC transporter substrate-binding protein [Acidobacteriota bacterium]
MKRLFLISVVLMTAASTMAPLQIFASGKLQVVSTLPDFAWLAQQVGGDFAQVQSLARGSQDPHFVDPKPSYLVDLHRADALLLDGMQLEIGWLPPLLQQCGNPRIQPGSPGYVDLSQFITPIEVPVGGVDRSMGDIHPMGNPHYHLDPYNMALIAEGLGGVFGKLDPSHAAQYAENGRKTAAAMRDLGEEIAKMLAPLKGEPVVTYHSTLDYFFLRYGFHVVGFVEPKAGIKPSPVSLMELEQRMKEKNAKLLITEAYQDLKTARRVAGDTGATLVVIPSYTGGAKGAETYPDLIRFIANAILEASRG